ncbi:hypothetical protein [Amycolatopsis sp.]|jgi:hypothetical protein|uniref:hypothetical protein n=1 Tax=Amycolatopsis sp. TaxID=37632 RepID=UPI002E0BBED9|nr:hypothetical protein [Amycolatopsis sp.]
MTVSAGMDLTAAILNALVNGTIKINRALASSNQTAGGQTDIAGTSMNIVTTVPNTLWVAFASFDVAQTTIGDTFVGRLSVGGVVQNEQAISNTLRACIGQHWDGVIASAGTTVFKLRSEVTAGADTSTQATHTKLTVIQFAL